MQDNAIPKAMDIVAPVTCELARARKPAMPMRATEATRSAPENMADPIYRLSRRLLIMPSPKAIMRLVSGRSSTRWLIASTDR